MSAICFLHPSFIQVISAVMLGSVHVQKVPSLSLSLSVVGGGGGNRGMSDVLNICLCISFCFCSGQLGMFYME